MHVPLGSLPVMSRTMDVGKDEWINRPPDTRRTHCVFTGRERISHVFHGAGGAEPDEDEDEGASKTCNTPEDFAEASSEGQQREQS